MSPIQKAIKLSQARNRAKRSMKPSAIKDLLQVTGKQNRQTTDRIRARHAKKDLSERVLNRLVDFLVPPLR